MHSAEIGQLRQLLALRDKLIKYRTAYKNAIKDLNDCFYEGETEFIRQTQLRLIKQLNIEINSVEQQIENIIQAMHEWKTNYKLIQTVKGIGPVIAKCFIIYTENFTRFSDPKKLACFADIAPFEYSSGSSIKGKNKMSTLNIIRNKLVTRVFAVVKRQTPYVDFFTFAA